MITDRGAVENLGPEDIPTSLLSGGHLHLVGYTFSGGSRRETALGAMRLAREADVTISVDPSAVPMHDDIGVVTFLAWTHGTILTFPNLQEGSLLAAAEDPDQIAK